MNWAAFFYELQIQNGDKYVSGSPKNCPPAVWCLRLANFRCHAVKFSILAECLMSNDSGLILQDDGLFSMHAE